MEIRRLDATPYLAEGEIVQYKTSAKQSRFKVIQLVLCWLIALVAVAGDCFLLSMTYALNEQLTNVNTFLMPLEICLIVERLKVILRKFLEITYDNLLNRGFMPRFSFIYLSLYIAKYVNL